MYVYWFVKLNNYLWKYILELHVIALKNNLGINAY